MTGHSFGDAYYGMERPAPRSRETEQERMIRELLGKDVRQRCEKAVRQWNQSVREQLRAESGLRLTSGDERRSIPVRVADGLPLPFHSVAQEFEDRRLWWLAMRRPMLAHAQRALQELQENFEQVFPLLPSDDLLVEDEENTYGSLNNSESLIDVLLNVEQSRKILKRIKQIRFDVLGAYFLKRPEVELYWMVIGLYGAILGVSIEDLLVVTMAHELAHGYSHIGCDIDGRQWNTEDFGSTDLRVVEGIAQFYTQATCRRMRDRLPRLEDAFEAVLRLQAEEYADFRTWLSGERSAGEVMRAGLLVCRVHSIRDYGQFRDALKEFAVRVGAKGPQREFRLPIAHH